MQNLLSMLTQAADEEQLLLEPLPRHAAADEAEHLRRQYALLLAALLTAQPSVSEAQTRLLRLLLAALALEDIRAALFEEARALEPASLIEAGRRVREAGYAEQLVLDALVLLRLDASLGDEIVQLVGELAVFLDLDAATLERRANDAAIVLGLHEPENASQPCCADPLLDLWPRYLPRVLTQDDLQQELGAGIWVVEEEINVHCAWKARDAVLVFRNQGAIRTIVPDRGRVSLENCLLSNAILDFRGQGGVNLKDCEWQGAYNPERKLTALNVVGPELTVTNSQFETREARAIWVAGDASAINNSRFDNCGNKHLDGGAIGGSKYLKKLSGCRFERCIAARGGAVFVNGVYGVSGCEFVSCHSLRYEGKEGADIALFGVKAMGESNVVINCVFRQTALYVGSLEKSYSDSVITSGLQFIQGNLYYCKNIRNSTLASNALFEPGEIIEKEFD